jgi:hypothetical protein
MTGEKDRDVPIKSDLDPEEALRILLRDERKPDDEDEEADTEDSGE